MLRCVGCKYNNDCTKGIRVEMENCTEYYPLTNADRIRAMPDDELAAELLWNISNNACPPEREYKSLVCIDAPSMCQACWLDWLQQEVDNG